MERHEILFKADVQKIKQWSLAIDMLNQKIRNELDDAIIRAGGEVPCRRKEERRKNEPD